MAEALKKASDLFAAAPQPPPDVAAAGRAQKETITRDVTRFEKGVAQWQAEMAAVRQGLSDLYASLSIVPEPAAQRQLDALDEFIESVDQHLESEKLALEQSKLAGRQAIANLRTSSSESAHFARKILKRIYEAGVAQHNARVDFYYFLLALRAEVNPDYRAGPTFENAEDLIADLRDRT